MKERPILMSAPMVRALLAGTKTQTRRVVTVPWHKSERALPYEPYWCDHDGKLLTSDEYGDWHPAEDCLNTYGRAGDALWVRETWAPRYASALANRKRGPYEVFYRADDERAYEDDGPWKPSIFMPRWASRITLELTDVRVERLQAISAADAIAEGVARVAPCGCSDCARMPLCPDMQAQQIAEYAQLWDSINGDRDGCDWLSNPWVWALTFTVRT